MHASKKIESIFRELIRKREQEAKPDDLDYLERWFCAVSNNVKFFMLNEAVDVDPDEVPFHMHTIKDGVHYTLYQDCDHIYFQSSVYEGSGPLWDSLNQVLEKNQHQLCSNMAEKLFQTSKKENRHMVGRVDLGSVMYKESTGIYKDLREILDVRKGFRLHPDFQHFTCTPGSLVGLHHQEEVEKDGELWCCDMKFVRDGKEVLLQYIVWNPREMMKTAGSIADLLWKKVRSAGWISTSKNRETAYLGLPRDIVNHEITEQVFREIVKNIPTAEGRKTMMPMGCYSEWCFEITKDKNVDVPKHDVLKTED